MTKKQQTTKRRVALEQQKQRHEQAAAKALRRKQLITGGIVAFLALALIAPLTAGLLGSNDDPVQVPSSTTSTIPTSLPWVEGGAVGASLTGPTPCPATDGTAERTTEFEQAPPICIEPDATYDLSFSTSVGDFSLPIDPSFDEAAANLATVFGWYHTYEQTNVAAVAGGLLWVGSTGDTGFTIPITPQDSDDDLYPVGSVLALPSIEGGLTGALIVVTEESGAALLRSDPRYVQVGMLDDVSDIVEIYNTPEAGEFLTVDSVEVSTNT